MLLVNNGLHIDILINRATPIGQADAAGVADVVVEAALSTILDLGRLGGRRGCRRQGAVLQQLAGRSLKGTLTESFEKGGKTVTRGLNADRVYTGANGQPVTLPTAARCCLCATWAI